MCGIYFEFRPVVQEEILFKIFLIYSSGSYLFSEAEVFWQYLSIALGRIFM